ncbi:MAG: lipase [Robiginitomaculum sp.]|nr:MAG: lipase [Robiginitomaculum sp.]
MDKRFTDFFTSAVERFSKETPAHAVAFARSAIANGKDNWQKPAPPIADARGVRIPSPNGAIAARLYTPLGAGVAPGPGLIFFHGGGFIVGDVASYDSACRRLAAHSRLRVLSVDYRLAPEHAFPAAHDDAKTALHWALQNANNLGMDADNLAVGGDSAGGTLAAWLGHYARDNAINLSGQLLIFPLLQLVETKSKQRKSPDAHLLGNQALNAIRKLYVADADPADPRLSPLFSDSFKSLPPALVITAGLDPLKAEGQAYADKLAAAGNQVQSLHFRAMPHGFISLTGLVPGALAASEESFERFGRMMQSLTD